MNSVVMAEGEGSGTAGAISEMQVKVVQVIFQQMLDKHLEAWEASTAGKEGKTGEGEASGSTGGAETGEPGQGGLRGPKRKNRLQGVCRVGGYTSWNRLRAQEPQGRCECAGGCRPRAHGQGQGGRRPPGLVGACRGHRPGHASGKVRNH